MRMLGAGCGVFDVSCLKLAIYILFKKLFDLLFFTHMLKRLSNLK